MNLVREVRIRQCQPTGGYIHYGDDVWWKKCLVQSRQMEIPVHRAAPPGNYEFSKRDEVVLRIKMSLLNEFFSFTDSQWHLGEERNMTGWGVQVEYMGRTYNWSHGDGKSQDFDVGFDCRYSGILDIHIDPKWTKWYMYAACVHVCAS